MKGEHPLVIKLLAKQLHENYRAACKAMGVKGPEGHDHGYNDCGGRKQEYFIKRAYLMVKRAGQESVTLGDAEQTLQASVFLHRLRLGISS